VWAYWTRRRLRRHSLSGNRCAMWVWGQRRSRDRVYPFRQASSCLLPVEILIHFLRIWPSSAAVMKPLVVGCTVNEGSGPLWSDKLTNNFLPASLIFSTLVSENPLILRSLLVVAATKLCSGWLSAASFNYMATWVTDSNGVDIVCPEFGNVSSSNA